MFTDNIQIYHSFSNSDFEIAEQNLNNDLETIEKITKQQSLMSNPHKSVPILFGKNQRNLTGYETLKLIM